MIQEAFGVNDHIQDVARRFAAEGYHAVAPALFHRAGGGTAPYDDFSKVMPLFEGVTDDGVLIDVDATLAHLARRRASPTRSIGIVGFCFGGRVTFLVAARRTLGAAVGFYGGGIAARQRAAVPAADRRGGVAADAVARAVRRPRQRDPGRERRRRCAPRSSAPPVDTDIVRYPDAEHGFHCDARASYHDESATDGWRRALEWFDTHLA